MKNQIFVFGLVILTISACRTRVVVNHIENISDTVLVEEKICVPIVKDTGAMYVESDPFLLVNASLDGKCLEIEVEYSGGCGGDTWTLAWDGNLMKSMPPKASIYLHLKDEDACRETVRKKIYFDISSIYNKGQVDLILKDFRGMLSYTPN